ncbi:MAG: hypothetical protein JST54_32910, partial [Deltaproteobacteria bacterium]|nr:hypothetical protein [Deltaproteobacteria bacterium]
MQRSRPSSKPLCAATPVVLNEREESLKYRAHQIENPTWLQVEAAIRRLDNAKFNEVSLDFSEGADRTSMMVSGGNEAMSLALLKVGGGSEAST